MMMKVFFGGVFFVIIYEVMGFGYDFVIKVSKGVYSWRIGFFGMMSMCLLWKCLCVVWFVWLENKLKFGCVLVVIDFVFNDIV